jgi:hypothetical protein
MVPLVVLTTIVAMPMVVPPLRASVLKAPFRALGGPGVQGDGRAGQRRGARRLVDRDGLQCRAVEVEQGGRLGDGLAARADPAGQHGGVARVDHEGCRA